MHTQNSIGIEILNSLKQGGKCAFEFIFKTYHTKIYHFVLSILYDKSLAEDITQNVFLSLWEHRQDIVPEKNFEAYLFTVAKNKIYREIEKKILAIHYEDYIRENPCGEDYSFEEQLHVNSLEELIIRLIEKLPETRRQILLLHFKEDLSNKVIAEKLCITEENVEIQLRRSLNYIQKYLKTNRAAIF